jgi:hypothetical protein
LTPGRTTPTAGLAHSLADAEAAQASKLATSDEPPSRVDAMVPRMPARDAESLEPLRHFALFMVEALTNDELIHEAPAIVGRQTPSALAQASSG